MSAPHCPNGHGEMEYRATEVFHEVSSVLDEPTGDTLMGRYAAYSCRTCGTYAREKMTSTEVMPHVCDFCSGPNPVKDYPCEDFVVVPLVETEGGKLGMMEGEPPDVAQAQGYNGEWFACAECARLIDANDQEALTLRAVDWRRMRSDDSRRLALDLVGQLHKAFFAHRIPERR